MAKRRKPQFKTSILSTFSQLPGSRVAKAAARRSGETEIPILVRPGRGKPVLLVPGRGRRMRAYDIKTKKGRLPRTYFDTNELLRNRNFELIPIPSRVLTVGRLKLTIEDGHLNDKIPQPVILLIRWGEISLPKPPTPPPPPTGGGVSGGG